jgi:hypothetical protein
MLPVANTVPVLMLVLLGATGCLVQSLQPHYREKDLVPAPAIAGHWQMVVRGSGKPSTNDSWRTWEIRIPGPKHSFARITTHDADGRTSQLTAMFFAVAGRTYCDIAGESTRAENSYWQAHFAPLHTLGRVELDGDRLRVLLLEEGFIRQAARNRDAAALPFVQREGGVIVTAEPDDWRAFLERHAAAPGLFATNNAYEFRRVAAPPP